jgi:CBS domain-containing protein
MKQGHTVLEAKRLEISVCPPTLTLLQAARRLMEEQISCLVVVDPDGYLIGVITGIDLLRAHLDHDDWARLSVGDHMSREVFTVAPDDQLRTVADLLLQKHIHRVIVVREEDGRRKPIGVVSAGDLVYHMTTEDEG